MTPPFTVRSATPDDAGLLASFRVMLFRELGHGPDAEHAAAFEKRCREAIRHALFTDSADAWLAEEPTGQAVGSLVLLTYPRLPSPKIAETTEGYIGTVFVVPAWRRRGVAAALTERAVTQARELGMARIRLHATEAGRPVYLGAGFKERADELELVLDARVSVSSRG